ncbi:MAG: GET complex subunit get1 [Peltula sp. TS41687]|nr:MAG: GET complex subunit get1 [Peltula sp. TS41687]
MTSLLLVVFILQTIITLISTIGSSTLNSALWTLYNRLPTSTSKAVRDQKKVQREYLRVRREMNSTSSQDEFAKWAKLRRQHDKLLEQLEKSSAALATSKSSFDSAVTSLRWTGTNGFRWLLQFWFTKEAMFWIPKGWLPYYVEWVLSFPKAPVGAVSIQIWWIACVSVIQFVIEVMSALYGVVGRRKEEEDDGRREKTSTGKGVAGGVAPTSSRREEGRKNEL